MKIYVAMVMVLSIATTGCSNKYHASQREALDKLTALGAEIELTSDKKANAISLKSLPVSDDDLVHLQGLDSLESVDLSGTDITGAAAQHLSALSNLKKLNLGGGYQKASKVDDSGLAYLKPLSQLEEIVLSDSQVTDQGLAHLAELKNLRRLYLFQTKITDAGLAHLEGLQKLETLRVGRTGVTAEGAAAFQAKMPALTKFVEASAPSDDSVSPSAPPADETAAP